MSSRHPAGISAMLESILLRAACLAILWWTLAEGRADGWALGSIAIALSTWASCILVPVTRNRISARGLLRFLAFFVRHSLRGGFQVAAMAIRGPAALRPGLTEFRVTLPPGGSRILLLNALGLMPGTLGVELAGETLRLHVLDDRQPVLAEAQALESVIGGIFRSPR